MPEPHIETVIRILAMEDREDGTKLITESKIEYITLCWHEHPEFDNPNPQVGDIMVVRGEINDLGGSVTHAKSQR